jgi:hypothetical protein
MLGGCALTPSARCSNKEAIEREIFFRVADLLSLDVEVIFYDLTSTYLESDPHFGRRVRAVLTAPPPG